MSDQAIHNRYARKRKPPTAKHMLAILARLRYLKQANDLLGFPQGTFCDHETRSSVHVSRRRYRADAVSARYHCEVCIRSVDLCLPNLVSTALNTMRSSSLKRSSIITRT